MSKNIETPLHVPMKAKSRKNKVEFLPTLKKATGLNLNEKKLMTAVSVNDVETVTSLLLQETNPNISDILLRSPLHIAASRGYKEIVNVLLLCGANPNQRDIKDNTALHLAACTNNLDIVTLLLDAGTDLSSLDKHGRNPCELAQSKLRLLQTSRYGGAEELGGLRQQIHQIIELMLSYLKRQQSDHVPDLELMKLQISQGNDAELDEQMSVLLNAIESCQLK